MTSPLIPSGVAILFFIDFAKGKTYKRDRGAKLQVFLCKKKITGRSPLKFLGKCAGGSLISVRPLCPVDYASDRSSNATAWEFLLAWFRKFLEREEDLRVLVP